MIGSDAAKQKKTEFFNNLKVWMIEYTAEHVFFENRTGNAKLHYLKYSPLKKEELKTLIFIHGFPQFHRVIQDKETFFHFYSLNPQKKCWKEQMDCKKGFFFKKLEFLFTFTTILSLKFLLKEASNVWQLI